MRMIVQADSNRAGEQSQYIPIFSLLEILQPVQSQSEY
jgi:hypothetical protein